MVTGFVVRVRFVSQRRLSSVYNVEMLMCDNNGTDRHCYGSTVVQNGKHAKSFLEY